MSTPSCRIPVLLAALVAAAIGTAPASGDEGRFLLVRRSLRVQTIQLTAITETMLEYRDEQGNWSAMPLSDAVALVDPAARPAKVRGGLLRLADGQQIPGGALSNASPEEEIVVWNHPWLGRMNVPLSRVSSMLLAPGATAPATDEADAVLLVNGDRWEGLITALGDPITLAIESGDEFREVTIPLSRAVAVSMVSPRTPPSGRRVWLRDGTVLDVQALTLGADRYVQLVGSLATGGETPAEVQLTDVVAVLFQSDRLRPMAMLRPSRVEGPETRYRVGDPVALDPVAPLDLQRLELHGPVIVHYPLPAGARRFAAEAVLPEASRRWGNYDLIIRNDDREVFRARLDGRHPRASIAVDLRGAELTIEMNGRGRYGPIEDRLILEQPMLLVEE